MTDHPHQLYAVEYTEADQARLVGFSCGNEPWSKHVGEWIKGSDVFDSIRRGTQVWLFEIVSGEIVGFASIGMSVWRWPPPDGERTTIALIPMLGIDTRYQGQPSDEAWRYSRQLMLHVIAEAEQMVREWPGNGGKPEWLVLMVRRDNARAIRFYEKFGFKLIPGVVRRNDHLVMTLWIGD